jgi:hypothetical protein
MHFNKIKQTFSYLSQECLHIAGVNIPRRSNPISRSDRFQSTPRRISSETDIFHKTPIGSDMVFVGFLSVGIRPGFHRNLTEPDEIMPRANNRIVRSYKILCSILYDLVRSYEILTKNRGSRNLALSRTIRFIQDLSVW